MRRTDVINWYLKEVESEIESEAQLEEKTFMISKVLDKLIQHVSVFILRLKLCSSRW